MGFEPMVSALALQRSTNWAMKTYTLRVGQFVEFIVPVKGMRHEYYVNCGHTNPVEAPKTFFGLTLRLLKSQLQLRWSDLHFIRMSAVHIVFIRLKKLSVSLGFLWNSKVVMQLSMLCPRGGRPRDRVGTLIRNKNLESNFLTLGIRFQFKFPTCPGH